MRQKCASLYSVRNALVCPLSAEMQTFAWTPRMWTSCYSVSVPYSLADHDVVNGKSYRIACYERKTHSEPENPTAQTCLNHTRCKNLYQDFCRFHDNDTQTVCNKRLANSAGKVKACPQQWSQTEDEAKYEAQNYRKY